MADDTNADKRSEHTVVLGGVEHTLLLDEDDAKRLGAQQADAEDTGTKAKQPANKSRTSSDK